MKKKGSIALLAVGVVLLIVGIVCGINTYTVKGNKEYAYSLIAAFAGVFAIISGIVGLVGKSERKPVDA